MKSEKKQTAINLIAKVISYGTTLLISFFLTPYLVEKLGKETYSFYPIANNFATYMNVVTMALNSMASRFITIALTKGNKDKANTYFVSIFAGNVIISVILLIPMSAVVIFLQDILNIPIGLIESVKMLFIFVFISMIVNLLTNVFGVAAFSQNRLELTSISEIVVGVTRVVLYIIMFGFFEPNICYVGIVTLIVAIITGGFQYIFTRKLLPFIKLKRKFFEFSAIKEVLASGIWNSVNQIGVILMSTMGLMLCNILYGAAEGGNYSVALTIPTFINGIVSMLSIVFLPGLTIKFAKGDRKEIVSHVHMAQNIIGMIVNIPISIFMAVGENFFQLWTPSMDAHKLQGLSILAISYLLVTSVAWPISNLNTVMAKVKIPAVVMVGSGIVNILMVMFFYQFTNIGVYSIPLSQLLLFIINKVIFVANYSAHCLNEKWYVFYPAIARNIVGAGCIFIFAYVINSIINPSKWVILIIECMGLGIFGLIVNMLIIFKKSGIKNFYFDLLHIKNHIKSEK